MKKIKLDLDDLKVESFDTLPDGAVFGYSTCPTVCQQSCGNTYCGSCETCPPTDCSCPPRSCIGSSGGFPCA
jgi:hypothetical protein